MVIYNVVMHYLMTAFILFLSINSLAFDVGNGSDGPCNLSGALDTNIKSVFNCTSLTINAPLNISGNSKLLVKVSGAVSISSNISLDGSIGTNGSNGISTGGVGGPGAFSGGSCLVNTSCNGSKGGDGSDGGHGGKGLGGQNGASGIGGNSGGGGGGGARYGDFIMPTNGLNSENDLATPVLGGSAGTTSYGHESGFTFFIVGGSGGGAGGSGDQGGTIFSGGAGGGGGGILQIQSSGDIVIEATSTISSNGGNGGTGDNAQNVSAGGGGGSGGAIFLRSKSEIINNGTLSALGGTGGVGNFVANAANNNGGNGGSGRIRLDDFDGVITGTGLVNPPAYVTTSATPHEIFESDIKCGAIPFKNKSDYFYALLFSFFLFLVINGISKRRFNIV